MARQRASTVQRGAVQCTKATEGRAGESSQNPFFPQLSAQALVEANRIFVPVEDRPLHAAAAASHRDLRERPKQRPARAVAARLGQDEEVLEVERGPAEERRVREVVEREADGRAAAPADERLEAAPPPQAVAADPLGGRLPHGGEAPATRDAP